MSCCKCCVDFDIDIAHLIFPERMAPDGREFLAAHGIDSVPLGMLRAGALDLDEVSEGTVKIRHRCQQLTDDGLCGIYEQRPAICRSFDCALRDDCTNART